MLGKSYQMTVVKRMKFHSVTSGMPWICTQQEASSCENYYEQEDLHSLSSMTDQRDGEKKWTFSFATSLLCNYSLRHHMGGFYEGFRLLNAFYLWHCSIASRDRVILQPTHWLKWQGVGAVLKRRPDPFVPNETCLPKCQPLIYSHPQ